MTQYTTDLAGRHDRRALLELQARVGSSFVSDDTFEHYRSGHPLRAAEIPVIRTAEGAIVGAAWVLPMQARAGREELLVGNVCNLHVDPAHAGGFAFAVLSRHVNRTAAELYPLHVSLVSKPTFERLASVTPNRTMQSPWLLRVLDPHAWARRYKAGGGRLPSQLITSLGNAMARGILSDVALDSATPSSSREHTTCVRRVPDSATSEWRYAPAGDREYRVIETSRLSTSGHAVLRVGPGPDPVAHLMEVQAEDVRDAHEVIKRVLGYCERRGISTIAAIESTDCCISAALARQRFTRNPLARLGRFGGLWPVPLRVAVVVHDPTLVPDPMLVATNWVIDLSFHESL